MTPKVVAARRVQAEVCSMVNKESFNWAATERIGASVHTQATITPCRGTLRDIESRVRVKHKLILNIIPF